MYRGSGQAEKSKRGEKISSGLRNSSSGSSSGRVRKKHRSNSAAAVADCSPRLKKTSRSTSGPRAAKSPDSVCAFFLLVQTLSVLSIVIAMVCNWWKWTDDGFAILLTIVWCPFYPANSVCVCVCVFQSKGLEDWFSMGLSSLLWKQSNMKGAYLSLGLVFPWRSCCALYTRRIWCYFPTFDCREEVNSRLWSSHPWRTRFSRLVLHFFWRSWSCKVRFTRRLPRVCFNIFFWILVFSGDVITSLIQSDEEKAWEPEYFRKLVLQQDLQIAGLIIVIKVNRDPSTGKFGFKLERKRHIIRGVVKDSYAHKQGLRNGDVLIDVEGVTFTTIAEVNLAVMGQTTIWLKIGKRSSPLTVYSKCSFNAQQLMLITLNTEHFLKKSDISSRISIYCFMLLVSPIAPHMSSMVLLWMLCNG